MNSIRSINSRVSRINGIDRYETSARIAKQFCKNPTIAVLAYGQNFPDGLAGGTLAYKVNAPLLLATSSSADNKSIANYVSSTQINSLYVLGGPGLISDNAAQSILKNDSKYNNLQTYKITYNLNGGKNSNANPVTYNVTSAFTFKNPSRSGYTFDGWYTDSKYTKKIAEIKKGSTGNKTLYARWKLPTYKITYNLNGGENSSANPVTYNVTSVVTFKNPSRSGYTFDGWYTDSKYTKKITEIEKGTTGDKTLYAKWIEGVKEPYTYTIKPVLAPFNNYYIVKTDDPNPYSLRFVNSTGRLTPVTTKFCDVNYVDAAFRRTAGGYLFQSDDDFAGGTVTVERAMSNGKPVTFGKNEMTRKISSSDHYMYVSEDSKGTFGSSVGTYEPRVNQVSVAPSKNRLQYLIDTYTSKDKTFFENMDAVQKALDQLAIYPVHVVDINTVSSEYPYLGLQCANAHDWGYVGPVDLRYDTTESLVKSAYPYILDSLGFPGLMIQVAQTLDPNCTFSTEGCMHWEINVTAQVNGKSVTKRYGGAGHGDSEWMYATSFMDARFKFDQSSSDFARNLDLDVLHSKLNEYVDKGKIRAQSLYTEVGYDELSKVIGNGAWLRTFGGQYTYITRECYQGPLFSDGMSNTWVDGRHLDVGCAFEKNAKWSDHPTDDIVLTNQTYKNQNADTRTADIYYEYDKESKTWIAHYAYPETSGYYSSGEKIPDQFVLTQDEVNELVNSAKWKHNNATDPTSGYIYDTKSKPGTPFKN